MAHTLDDTTQHHLKNELFADSDVQFYWYLTNTSKTDNLKAELLELCIDRLIDTCLGELHWKFNTGVL